MTGAAAKLKIAKPKKGQTKDSTKKTIKKQH